MIDEHDCVRTIEGELKQLQVYPLSKKRNDDPIKMIIHTNQASVEI